MIALDGGPRLRRRQSAGRNPLSTMLACPESRKGHAAADDSRRRSRRHGSRTSCASRTATWKIWGNSLGRARLPRRPAEPARRTGQRIPGPRTLTVWRGATITAQLMPSARRSTTSYATRRSPASPSSRAIATASGPDMRQPSFRREQVRAGRTELRRRVARKPRRRWRPMSMAYAKITPLARRCSSLTGRMAVSRTGPTTCC